MSDYPLYWRGPYGTLFARIGWPDLDSMMNVRRVSDGKEFRRFVSELTAVSDAEGQAEAYRILNNNGQ